MKGLVYFSAIVAAVYCQFTAEEQQIINLLNSDTSDPSDFENIFVNGADFATFGENNAPNPYNPNNQIPYNPNNQNPYNPNNQNPYNPNNQNPYNPYNPNAPPPYNPNVPPPYNPYQGQTFNQYGNPQYFTTRAPVTTTGYLTRPRTNFGCDLNCKDRSEIYCSIAGGNCRGSGIGKLLTMATLCPASCGLCRRCPVHARPCTADGSCVEHNTLICLSHYAPMCALKNSRGAVARQACPITCQTCRPCEVPPTTTPQTCTNTCEDKNKVDCPGWANQRNSFCHISSKYQSHMIENCALSCKFCFRCDATTTPSGPNTTYPVPPQPTYTVPSGFTTGYPAPPAPATTRPASNVTTTLSSGGYDPLVEIDFDEFDSIPKIDTDSFSEFFTEETSPEFKEIVEKLTASRKCERSVSVHATIQEQCLSTHNYYRCLHGSPELTYDGQLEKTAQLYARKMAFNGKAVIHSVRPSQFGVDRKPGVGENLAWWQSKNNRLSVNRAIAGWYAEGLVYDYENPLANRKQTEHFTQVVWKETSRVGCAVQQVRDQMYVVAHYFTIGNHQNSYKENVMPLRPGICKNSCGGGYCHGNEGGVSKCSCDRNQPSCTGRCVAYCPKPSNYRGYWNMRCEGVRECMCMRSRFVRRGQRQGAICT